MLQHDYLLEIIGRFVESVSDALTCMLRDGDMGRAGEVEDAIGELLDLDAHTAMSLSPQSLVTMMTLSGVGESVAAYVSYVLERLARAYEKDGDARLAAVRRSQAEAIARAFHAAGEVPPEFESLEARLS